MPLSNVVEVLSSSEHYQKTETRHYGDLDPIVATYNHIAPCKCGNLIPALSKFVQEEKLRHRVECHECNNFGEATRKPWQAILKWNSGPFSVHYRYENIPFFQLRGLNITQARARLVSIKDDLLFRKREAILRRELGDSPGGQYVERLEAYLAWALHGLDILREAGREKYRQETS